MNHTFASLDHELLVAVGRGDIRFLSVKWLLRSRDADGPLRRRQELEAHAFLTPAAATKALKANRRRIFVLSYGWGLRGEPDPSGEIQSHLTQFLTWYADWYCVSERDLDGFGVFWVCVWEPPRAPC